jgi:hypothetical protein
MSASNRRAADPIPVCAGGDQQTTLPKASAMVGRYTVSPSTGVTIQWKKVSGPGRVAFADASAVATTATFQAPGRYTLQLSVNGPGGSTGSDIANVLVYPPSETVLTPVLDATASYDAEDAATAGSHTLQPPWGWCEIASRGDSWATGKCEQAQYFVTFDVFKVKRCREAILRIYGGLEHGGQQTDWTDQVFNITDEAYDPAAISWNTRPPLGSLAATFLAHSYT